uniref:Uncharacterized protein n=1 Tax=Rhizophora mucronata TaxID=61149 RepID=A0A2P2QQN4_RHIMU
MLAFDNRVTDTLPKDSSVGKEDFRVLSFNARWGWGHSFSIILYV